MVARNYFDKEKVLKDYTSWITKYEEILKQPEVVAEIARREEEIKELKKAQKLRREKGLELRDYKIKLRPPIPRSIAQAFIDITEKISGKPNFSGYPKTWKEEMEGRAMEFLVLYFDGYDITKNTSIFAYFSQIAHNGFLQALKVRQEEKTDDRYIIERDGTTESDGGVAFIGDIQRTVYEGEVNIDELHGDDYIEALPESTIYKIYELRGEGKNHDEIKKEVSFKPHTTYITKILKGEYFYYIWDELGKPEFKEITRASSLPREERIRWGGIFYEEYKKTNSSLKKIGKKYKRGTERIRHWMILYCQEKGIEFVPNNKKTPLSPSQIQEILDHPVYRGSQKELARKYNVSNPAISNIINRKDHGKKKD